MLIADVTKYFFIRSLLLVTVNMKSAALFIIVVTSVVGVCDGIRCFVCETEENVLRCKMPNEPSVQNLKVYCDVDGRYNVCSYSLYKRKCRDGDSVVGKYCTNKC